MYNLATIKYPTDPRNRSYKPSRALWVSHYARQIHLAIANGATPAISYTMRNLMSDLSRTALPPDLDPCIPAFQLNNTVLSERHPDNSAYESLDATGRIIVQATPAYHLEPNEPADSPSSEQLEVLNILPSGNNATSSIDIDSIATSNNQLNSQVIQHQHQSLSVPLVQQSVSGAQHPLLRSLAQQPRIEKRQSTDLNIPIDIMDDTSSTLVRTLDQDTSDIDNISEVSESQSIDINTININNNVSHDYESSSNEIRNISPMDIIPDNHFSSSNIATRVKARNERARRKTAHKQSQHFKTRNLGNTSSSESPSHEY